MLTKPFMAGLLGVSGLALPELAAASEINLCNDTDKEYRYAIIHNIGFIPPLMSNWRVKGWFFLKRGCVQLADSGSRQEMFLSIQTVVAPGTYTIQFYEMGSSSRIAVAATSSGAERFFCVKAGNFERAAKTLEEHELCPEGYYLQIFNLHVFASVGTDYTVTLR